MRFVTPSVLLILGYFLIVANDALPIESGKEIGFVLVGVAAPLAINAFVWGLRHASRFLSNIYVPIELRKRTGFRDGQYDRGHDGKLITRFLHAALRQVERDQQDLLLVGTTLQSLFGSAGLFSDANFVDDLDNLMATNRSIKKIRVLIINPYCQQAIIRSLSESQPFGFEEKPPYQRILDHSAQLHESSELVRGFSSTLRFLSDGKYQNLFEARVYSCCGPYFGAIIDDQAFYEELVFASSTQPSKKLSGRMPVIRYDRGESASAIAEHFEFVWQTVSIPLADFDAQVERSYFAISQFQILLNLQRTYWEDRWRRDIDREEPRTLFDVDATEHLEGMVAPIILDLGCGSGGGGSMSLAEECSRLNGEITAVDFSAAALRRYEARMSSGVAVNFEPNDILSVLRQTDENSVDLVYANYSIIYMTMSRASEIYKEVFRVIKPGGVFLASVFNNQYFDRETMRLRFETIPAVEDLRVIVSSGREGEIRRFYKTVRELFDELENGEFRRDNVSVYVPMVDVPNVGPQPKRDTYHVVATK